MHPDGTITYEHGIFEFWNTELITPLDCNSQQRKIEISNEMTPN